MAPAADVQVIDQPGREGQDEVEQPDVSRETSADQAAAIPRIPWSQIWPEFIASWGYPDGKFNPQHLEILGPNGSGKTYVEATILQQRVAVRGSAVIFIATKPVDETILKLGWPIVKTWREVTKRENRQCIFWPRTKAVGQKRAAFLEAKIYELLARLWAAKAKVIVVFDEIGTVEGLSSRLKSLIAMYWREARSVGITIVAMKQRGQGVQRDMHSEAAWIIAFKPKHEDDGKYVGSVMGSWREWKPVLDSLNREAHEFVILNTVTYRAVISWVDLPLQPAVPEKRGLYQRKAAA
jgi:nucleoside-triphosphatase THEP1